MLLPWCPGDPPPEVCCTSIYDAADELLTIAQAAFEDCVPPDACAPMQYLVAAAEPHFASQDYLAVWWSGASFQPPRGLQSQSKGLTFTRPQLSFSVKLVESGYPTLEQALTEIHEPTAAEVQMAALQFLAHVEQVYRTVLDTLTTDNACGELKTFTDLRPIAPSGGSIAAQFGVVVEMK